MEILVCVKRVPDSAENEISVGPGGADIRREDLVYSVNEWDNYAVEEAIQIVERDGGNVTVVSVGDYRSRGDRAPRDGDGRQPGTPRHGRRLSRAPTASGSRPSSRPPRRRRSTT